MGFNIRERFRERKNSYIRKKEIDEDLLKEEKEKKAKYEENPLKIIIFSPLIIAGFIKKAIDYFSSDNNSNEKKQKSQVKNDKNLIVDIQNDNEIVNTNNKVKQFFSNKVKKKSKQDSNNNINNSLDIIIQDGKLKNDDVEILEKKIINKFIKKLIKLKKSTDILESEIYLINKYSNDKELKEKREKIQSEIKVLFDKVEEVNRQYKILKENNLIEESLLIDDFLLLEDILKYKELISKEDINVIPNKIKILKEYCYLYDKVDNLEKNSKELYQKSEKRAEELFKRDNKYKKVKMKTANLEEINFSCNTLISKQNEYLQELCNKIGKIDRIKYTKNKLIGLDTLLSSSIRYLGLLALTPFRGIIPSLSVKILATRKIVHNMRKNLHYEEQEKVVYQMTNYEFEINRKLYDINSVEGSIDLALQEIVLLKQEFKNYFFNYHLDEYKIAFSKIEKIEKIVIDNKKKIEYLKEKLRKNRQLNDQTLKKVRKLNS